MSKELEIMKEERERLVQEDYADYCIEECDLVIKALQRLESIDNANPSEALECLDRISKEEIVVRNRSSIYMNPDDNSKGAFTHLTTVGQNFRGAIDTIKQALLKAQEPKSYIKWEDLEFEDGVWKNVEVVLNGTKYTLNCYKNCIEYTYVKIYLNGIVVADLCSTYKADKQFFNDLHLERVEE